MTAPMTHRPDQRKPRAPPPDIDAPLGFFAGDEAWNQQSPRDVVVRSVASRPSDIEILQTVAIVVANGDGMKPARELKRGLPPDAISLDHAAFIDLDRRLIVGKHRKPIAIADRHEKVSTPRRGKCRAIALTGSLPNEFRGETVIDRRQIRWPLPTGSGAVFTSESGLTQKASMFDSDPDSRAGAGQQHRGEREIADCKE